MATTDGSQKLEQVASKAGSLYSLPAVAVEVLRLTSQPQVDVHQIQLCIEKDPALTGRILRVVNSSLFGLGRHVSSLNQALALLGIKPLKLLVLGFSLPSELFVGVAGDMLGRFWRRTLTKAVAARELSETIWKIPGDEAFLAGLLQNIGMLALIQELGPPYLEVLETALSKSNDVGITEFKALGFTHYELSARMLERWGLPANLVSLIGIGSNSERIEALQPIDRSLPQILHLAEILSSLLAENRGDLLPPFMRTAIRYCNLTHPQLLTLVNDLQDKVRQFADVLNLEIFGGHDFTSVLLAAHSQMSAVAADAANDLIRAYRFIESSAETEQALASRGSQADARFHAAGGAGVLAESPEAGLPTLREQFWTDGSTAAAVRHKVSMGERPSVTVNFAETRTAAKAGASIAETVEAEFLALLTCVATSCRQAREPVNLLLISIEPRRDGRSSQPEELDLPFVEMVRESCRGAGLTRGICWPVDPRRLALILPGSQRQEAVNFGNQLIQELNEQSLMLNIARGHDSQTTRGAAATQQDSTLSVCIGLAAIDVPPKNLVLREWIARAERCLKAVERTGASGLKSIEIY